MVGDQAQQLVLVAHVAVGGHGRDAELLAQPPHGETLHALGPHDGGGRLHDLALGQAGRTARCALCSGRAHVRSVVCLRCMLTPMAGEGMAALADELFDHLRRYELPMHLLAEDAVHYLSFLDAEQPATTMAQLLGMERSLVQSSDLELRRRTLTDDGFVLQLVSTGTTTGGVDFRVPACLVVSVVGGRIVRLEEYADSRQAKPLLDEMRGLQT